MNDKEREDKIKELLKDHSDHDLFRLHIEFTFTGSTERLIENFPVIKAIEIERNRREREA